MWRPIENFDRTVDRNSNNKNGVVHAVWRLRLRVMRSFPPFWENVYLIGLIDFLLLNYKCTENNILKIFKDNTYR